MFEKLSFPDIFFQNRMFNPLAPLVRNFHRIAYNIIKWQYLNPLFFSNIFPLRFYNGSVYSDLINNLLFHLLTFSL